MAVTHALTRLQVVGAMVRTPGQALIHLLVHNAAVVTLPAGFAVTLAGNARTVAGAGWIDAIGCITGQEI
jgi:hypothetical protein